MSNPSSRKLAQSWPHERYSRYEDRMRSYAADWFREKEGVEVHPRMPYCLAKHAQWADNMVSPDVVDYIKKARAALGEREAFPLHKYLHHGLSSQAMVFNLVGSLAARQDLEPLRVALTADGVPWPGEPDVQFEFDDRDVFNEDSGQPTSIDVRIGNLFVEAKLVEREFGGCSILEGGDCDGANPVIHGLDGCYLHHIGRRYWRLAEEHGFTSVEIMKGATCPFGVYYQFFREILFAIEKGGHFVLLYDARNPAFTRGSERGLWPILRGQVPAEHQDRLHAITIQEVAEAIQRTGRHKDWIHSFTMKYGLRA